MAPSYDSDPFRYLRGRATGRFMPAGGPVYDPDALALFARFTAPPIELRKVLINNLIVALKAAGVWSKLDALYLMAAADSQAARRNWIADQYNLIAVSTPAFVADRGYVGNGTSSYLDTEFNPVSAVSPKLVLNNSGFGIWARTAGISPAIGATTNGILPLNTDNKSYFRVATTIPEASSGFPPNGIGLFQANRVNATEETLRRNAVPVGGPFTTNSSALESGSFWLCGRNTPNAYSTTQISAAYIGGGLTVPQQNAIYTALNTYMLAVGAI